LGDLNIDLARLGDQSTRTLVLAMMSSGLIPVITAPTRVTPKSSTIIDHIWIEHELSSHQIATILKTDISDHYPCLCSLPLSIPLNYTPRPPACAKRMKVFSGCNHTAFSTEILAWPHMALLQSHDIKGSVDKFLSELLDIYHRSFPTVRAPGRSRSSTNPAWMTSELLIHIHNKKAAYHDHLDFPDCPIRVELYRDLNRVAKSFIRSAKAAHLSQKMTIPGRRGKP
jgi:hypothetical protein